MATKQVEVAGQTLAGYNWSFAPNATQEALFREFIAVPVSNKYQLLACKQQWNGEAIVEYNFIYTLTPDVPNAPTYLYEAQLNDIFGRHRVVRKNQPIGPEPDEQGWYSWQVPASQGAVHSMPKIQGLDVYKPYASAEQPVLKGINYCILCSDTINTNPATVNAVLMYTNVTDTVSKVIRIVRI